MKLDASLREEEWVFINDPQRKKEKITTVYANTILTNMYINFKTIGDDGNMLCGKDRKLRENKRG